MTIESLVVALFFVFTAPVGSHITAQTVPTETRSDRETKPLFLHWIKPSDDSNRTPARRILTLRIHAGEDFEATVVDSTDSSFRYQIKGRIRHDDDKYIGKVEANWLCGTRFEGEFKLDKPTAGAASWFAGEYLDSLLMLSRERSAEQFLKIAANQDGGGDQDKAEANQKSGEANHENSTTSPTVSADNLFDSTNEQRQAQS